MSPTPTWIDEIVNLRHRLHRLAEPSGEERRTASAVKEFISGSDPDRLREGIGGEGLLAIFESGRPGPETLVRAELDALPIDEQLSVEHRSQREGTSHKCGHDGHMAIVCGLSRHLGEHPPRRGKVHLLFQPSEETGEGARAMLDSPELEDLSPDHVFALHNLPGYKRNRVIVRRGVFAAGSTGIIARFRGGTSHAAHPEQGRSPALAMAQYITSLSAIPQFYAPLDESAKVTVVRAELGERAFGTSPGEAAVMATLRAYGSDVLERILERARAIGEGLARTYGLELAIEETEPFPVTRNDPEAVGRVIAAAGEMGLDLLEKESPFGWSEDFGHFTAEFPGALFGLGSGTGHPPLHDGSYDFPDEILETGITLFVRITEDIHQKEKEE